MPAEFTACSTVSPLADTGNNPTPWSQPSPAGVPREQGTRPQKLGRAEGWVPVQACVAVDGIEQSAISGSTRASSLDMGRNPTSRSQPSPAVVPAAQQANPEEAVRDVERARVQASDLAVTAAIFRSAGASLTGLCGHRLV